MVFMQELAPEKAFVSLVALLQDTENQFQKGSGLLMTQWRGLLKFDLSVTKQRERFVRWARCIPHQNDFRGDQRKKA